MRLSFTRIAAIGGGLLLLGVATGCADPARIDVAQQHLDELRAQGAQQEAKLAWLAWGQVQITRELQARDSRAQGEMAQRLQSLEAENASLAQRLARAEESLSAQRPRSSEPAAEIRPSRGRRAPRPAPDSLDPRRTRTLDESIPYDLRSAAVKLPGSTGGGKRADVRRADKLLARTLDEVVPYDQSPMAAGSSPVRSLDETIPY
jgi:hypothetical protein